MQSKQRESRVKEGAIDQSQHLFWAAVVFLGLMIAFLSQGISAAPNDLQKDLEVAVWTAEENDLPDLENRITRLIQNDRHSVYGHALLSAIYVRLFSSNPGDLALLKLGSNLAQQAVDLNPTSDIGYVALANIFDVMGNSDRALALLNDAESIGVQPSWRVYFARARLVADRSNIKDALNFLQTALAFVDVKKEIVVPYAVALLQAELTGPQLVSELDNWNFRFESPIFELTKAITLADSGQLKESIDLYDRIIVKNPMMKEARINRAILNYQHLAKHKDAIAEMEDVLKIWFGKINVSTEALIRTHLGAAYLQTRDYASASDQFLTSIRLDTSNVGIVDFIVTKYKAAEAHEQLVEIIQKMNFAMPGTGLLHALLGETLSEKLEDHEAALKAFGDAIALDPERSDFYNGLGLTYYRQKEYTAALKVFAAATEINPSDATVRYNEACVLSILNRDEEALSSLGDALAMDPNLLNHARDDKDFANIRRLQQFQDLVRERSPLDDEGRQVIGH